MSRATKLRREIKIFKASCIARVPVEDDKGAEIEDSCEHGPGGSMIWGDSPRVFCRECIHYQRGHEPEHGADEEQEEDE